MTPILLSWSSGKDSAWTLHMLRQNPAWNVVGLFTTVNSEFDRVAMHGLRRELLEQQAACVNLPIDVLEITYPCSNEIYEQVMGDYCRSVVARGIHHMAFGDL